MPSPVVELLRPLGDGVGVLARQRLAPEPPHDLGMGVERRVEPAGRPGGRCAGSGGVSWRSPCRSIRPLRAAYASIALEADGSITPAYRVGNVMEIGIYTFAELQEDPHDGHMISPRQRMRDLVEEAELADQVGLDVFGVGEHHRADLIVSSPAVALAAVAGTHDPRPSH